MMKKARRIAKKQADAIVREFVASLSLHLYGSETLGKGKVTMTPAEGDWGQPVWCVTVEMTSALILSEKTFRRDFVINPSGAISSQGRTGLYNCLQA